MSNRIERTADKKTVEKHQKILKDLLQLPENRICVDCKKRDPRWASANLGVFICLRCSGVHRSLGVHISKVRSVDLDTWIPEHIDIMCRWGNARANAYWEAALPRDFVPDEAKVEQFIRSKYEYKKFCRPGPMPEPESLQVTGAPSVTSTASAPAALAAAPQPPPAVVTKAPSVQPIPVQLQSTSFGDDWAAFSTAPAPVAQAPPLAQPAVQAAAAPATALKANILSLYNKPAAPASAPAQFQASAPGWTQAGPAPNAFATLMNAPSQQPPLPPHQQQPQAFQAAPMNYPMASGQPMMSGWGQPVQQQPLAFGPPPTGAAPFVQTQQPAQHQQQQAAFQASSGWGAFQ